jgi:hypothetical protein
VKERISELKAICIKVVIQSSMFFDLKGLQLFFTTDATNILLLLCIGKYFVK